MLASSGFHGVWKMFPHLVAESLVALQRFRNQIL
jgi:hypothetical protein